MIELHSVTVVGRFMPNGQRIHFGLESLGTKVYCRSVLQVRRALSSEDQGVKAELKVFSSLQRTRLIVTLAVEV
jgi:hypothetical protein